MSGTSLAVGDQHCPYGGVEYTASSGPSYVCNGAPGSDPALGQNTNTSIGGAAGATCTIGEILMTAGLNAVGVVANGQYLNRNDEPVLFAVIGTKYGDDPNGLGVLYRVPDLTAAAPNGMTYSICNRGVFPSAN